MKPFSPGKKGPVTRERAPAAATARAKGLHRREGSRPVGKSRNKKGVRILLAVHPTPVANVPIIRGDGKVPGSTTRPEAA
jgi:hypothetical protein